MWITLRYEWSINPISLVYERTFLVIFIYSLQYMYLVTKI